MKRRDFLQAAAASVLPVIVDGFGARALGMNQNRQSAFMRALRGLGVSTDRVLVLIQLNGGNDGLNMVLPLDQMSQYNTLRSNIAIPESRVLKLASNAKTGLHPAMTGLQSLYNEGKVSIVHSVSYPSPDFSHFRASDIWFTGADSGKTLTTGWMGRYLDDRFPEYPADYPSQTMPDPLAIQIGYIASTALLGPKQSMAIALQDPTTFARLVGDKPNVETNPTPNTPAGQRIAFIRQQQTSSFQYAGQIKAAADKGKNLATYPTSNSLADQLRIVARLIHGGLQTKVYYVTIGGFDTHANQTDGSDTTVGAHANLMKWLSDGVKAFMDDLKMQGTADRVVGMTFSEFGRRAVSNNSRGTDHGVAAPLFVFGNAVKTPVIGQNPNLLDLDNNNIRMQTDFRQVYAALLGDWLGEGDKAVTDVLFRDYQKVPVFQQSITGVEPAATAFRIYPNPATDQVLMESEEFAEGISSVALVDASGRLQRSPVSRVDERTLQLNVRSLGPGPYLVQIETRSRRLTSRLMVVR